jgi:hypothetical protein
MGDREGVLIMAEPPRRRRGRRRQRPNLPIRQTLICLLLTPRLLVALARPAVAQVADCRAWRESRGVERIRRGNALGEAHFLTKDRRLQTSPDSDPISLYRTSDLRRLCFDR